jgi:putative endonuclease
MKLLARIKSLFGAQPQPEHLRRGQLGEAAAKQHLQRLGLKFLAANFRSERGELDLIFRDADCLVFVEVKTRSSTAYGMPEESITASKKTHLLSAIQAYMQRHSELPGNWRLDVLAIQRDRTGGSPLITHFENAFS